MIANVIAYTIIAALMHRFHSAFTIGRKPDALRP